MYKDRPLIDYLPDVLRGVREYTALTAAEEHEVSQLWAAVSTALNDQFVSSASEFAVTRWEKILKITPKPDFTLDERKFTILTRLTEQLPFSVRMLTAKLGQLCGPDGYEFALDGFSVHVRVALKALKNYTDIETMLKRICPANLAVVLSIKYNQHFVISTLKHKGLKAKTHYQLRNEVLNAENK